MFVSSICLDRTIRMLFRNAKDLHNNNVGAAIVDKLDYFRSVRLIGNGTVHLLNGQQVNQTIQFVFFYFSHRFFL